MTRNKLIQSLATISSELPLARIESVIKYIFDLMTKSLSDGERIEIRGFGTFSIRTRAARVARNPRTGETFQLEAKRAIHFKPGKELKNIINGEQEIQGS